VSTGDSGEAPLTDTSTIDGAALDGSTPLLSTNRNELRIPRGHTTTIEITIDRNRLDGDVQLAVQVPDHIELVRTSPTAKGMSATLKASDTAPTITAVVKFVATVAGRSGSLDVDVRSRAPGTLDELFPKDKGVEITKIPFVLGFAVARGRQAFVALSTSSASPVDAGSFLFARVNEDGALDPTFGAQGEVAFPIPSDQVMCTVRGFAVEPGDTTLFAAGCGYPEGGVEVPVSGYVGRIHSDGGTQQVTYPFGSSAELVLALGPRSPQRIFSRFDGGAPTIVRDIGGNEQESIAGFSIAGLATADGGYQLYGRIADGGAVTRVNDVAAVDTSFGTNGFAPVPGVVPGDLLAALATAQDGLVITLGNQFIGTRIVKMTPTGTPDPTFGTGGIVTLSSVDGYASVDVDERENVTIATTGVSSMLVRRFDKTGAPDTTFGTAGSVALAGSYCLASVAHDEDGMLLVMCSSIGAYLYRVWP
jgi:uncharacterized delta-60 repeat protein